jgi:hypothetical protein
MEVFDNVSPSRRARVEDGAAIISNTSSNITRMLRSELGEPFVGVIALNSDFLAVATANTLVIIYYTLPLVIETVVWTFENATIFGTFHETVPSLLMMWVESTTFGGMCIVPHLGLVHPDAVCPIFYTPDNSGVPDNVLETRAPSFVDAAGGVDRDKVQEARAFSNANQLPWSTVACCWRKRCNAISAILMHENGCTSVSVPFDTRLMYTSAHSEPKSTLSIAHMLLAPGGETLAVHSMGTLETICMCTGTELAIVDCEAPAAVGVVGGFKTSVQVIKLPTTATCWEVEVQGTAIIVTTPTDSREIRPSCFPNLE